MLKHVARCQIFNVFRHDVNHIDAFVSEIKYKVFKHVNQVQSAEYNLKSCLTRSMLQKLNYEAGIGATAVYRQLCLISRINAVNVNLRQVFLNTKLTLNN